MIFDQNQIEELFQIIDTFHTIFISTNIGKEILSNNDKILLKNAGINIDKIPNQTLFDNSFKFGVLAESLGDKNTKNISYNDFKKYLKNGNFIPLNTNEEKALERVKYQAYSDIKALGNKVQRELAQKNIEVSLGDAVKNRKTVYQMTSDLASKHNEWERDFARISNTLMHNVYEEGRAVSLEEKFGDEVQVYKEVMRFGACRHCIRLYLTNGIDSPPRIFTLRSLRANGSNIGRKVADWKATLPSLHAHCRCTLHIVPENFIWNQKDKAFTTPKEWIRRVNRKSKIQIEIGDKTYEI